MPTIEFQYGFDELKIEIAGVSTGFFYGHAILVSDERWPEDWSVEEIKFDDGARLLKSDSRACADPFTRELFLRCAKVIEADTHAQEFFCEQLAEHNQPDPDQARDERMDREFNREPPVFSTMYGTPLVQGASMAGEVR